MAEIDVPLTIALSVPAARAAAGTPFALASDTPPGWYDQGDGSGPRYWPDEGSFYTQPGEYVLTHHAYDGRAAELPVTVRGAPAFTTSRQRVELGTDDLRALGFSGTDNGVHCCRGPGGERLYFFAHPDSEDGWQTWDSHIVRLTVQDGKPLRYEVHMTKVVGNPLRGHGYLDSGPVIRYGNRLWMLALGGLKTKASTHGSVELLWSDDWGTTWTWAGTALAQPFTVAEHEAAGPTAAANMGVGGILVADADGDGRDFIYCYFHHAEAGGELNPLGVARADVAKLDEAVAAGRSVYPLWGKRLGGEWAGAYNGPADTLLRCGGWPSVVWCAPLSRYLLLTSAPAGTGRSLFYLSSSQHATGPWSEPALVYAETRPGWYASVPTFDAPDGFVDREFTVMLGPCWQGGADGDQVTTAHEVHAVTVRMV